MDNTTNYQCPTCTAPLRFDAKTAKLSCDYCSGSFEVEQIQKLYSEKNQKAAQNSEEAGTGSVATAAPPTGADANWNSTSLNSDWGADAQQMHAYNCTSCGAQIMCDNTTAATSCLYCGNNTVVPGRFDGALKPDYVIPFKVDKADVKAALQKHCKGKVLLPKFFAKDVHIEEVKGVYVPVWLFDGAVEADVHYKATESSTSTSGDYQTTTTKHYDVRREGKVEFLDIPVDSSSKMPDIFMESIEPFDYGALKPFSMAYMPGFLADKYDVSIEECSKRADERALNATLVKLKESAKGYSTCNEQSRAVNLLRGDVHYAMVPVWLLTTKYRGKVYLFAMNGQTGRFCGDLPCDMVKFFIHLALSTSIITTIAYIIQAILMA